MSGFTSTVLANGLKQAALANSTLRELVVAAVESGAFNFWRTAAFVAFTRTLFR